MSFTYSFTIDHEKWEAVASSGEKTDTTYVYGAIFYVDVFGPKRETRFAARYYALSADNLILEDAPGYTYSS